MSKKISLIITGAGQAKRLEAGINKTLLKIYDKRVLELAIDALIQHKEIFEIIISYHQNDYKAYNKIISKYQTNSLYTDKAIKLVEGGKERHDSVLNCLKTVDSNADYVMIHDAARPFLPTQVYQRFILEINNGKEAIIPYIPCFDTTLYVHNDKIHGNLYLNKRDLSKMERELLFNIQTPQCFSKRLADKIAHLIESHEINYTDESTALLKTDERIMFIEGSKYLNKITTMEDFEIAEQVYYAYLKKECE